MIRTLKKGDWFHADGFPIAVERRNPQQPFGLHTHEFSELVIVTGGHGLHVTGSGSNHTDSWQLSVGDVFVISGSRPHDYRDLKDLQLINVLFDQQELSFDLLDLPSLAGYHALFLLEPAWRKRHDFKSRLRLSPTHLQHAVGMLDELDSELSSRNTGFGFMAMASFMKLVGFLSRCYDGSTNADSRALLRIATAITHLESQFDKTLVLDDLVEMSQMSKRSFLRAFGAATGCTPIAYVIQLRLARGAKLLRQSNESVTQIAYGVGFQDSNYFARQFRKHFGVSPRTYRQQNGV